MCSLRYLQLNLVGSPDRCLWAHFADYWAGTPFWSGFYFVQVITKMDKQCSTNMTKNEKSPILLHCMIAGVFIQPNSTPFLLSDLTTNSCITTNTQALLRPVIRQYCFLVQQCCAVGARKSRQCSECVECSSCSELVWRGWFCSCHSHLGKRTNRLGGSEVKLWYISPL